MGRLLSGSRRGGAGEVAVVAALLLLPLLFFWRLWAPGPADRATIPEGDFTQQYYPLQLFAARELAAGRLPGWDPYINAGQPGLADIQTGFYYPINLALNGVLAVAGRPFSVGLLTGLVVLHLGLAGLFTYLFVRHLARRAGATRAAARFAGAVAALSFAYSGYLTSFPVQQPTILETAIWLPLILLFLDRAAGSRRSLPGLILAGVALALALLAGHPQTAMYVTYATVGYGLFLGWEQGRGARQDEGRKTKDASRFMPILQRTPDVSRFTFHAARFALAPVVVGVGLATVQLAPTLGLIAHSTRSELGYQAVSSGFLLSEVSHLLWPGYFGGSPQYVGILPLVLAVAALPLPRWRRQAVFWLAVGAVAFLLSFGGNTFAYSLAYLALPGMGAVRNQERIIYLFALAVAVLAGGGALALVQPLPPVERRGVRRLGRGLAGAWVAGVVVAVLFYMGHLQAEQQDAPINLFEGALRHQVLLLAVLGGTVLLFWQRLKGRARRAWLMILALGLIGLNLFTVNWQYNLAEPPAGGPFPQTGLASFVQSLPGTQRISSAGLLPGGASAGIVYQVEDITGNTPLRLAAFEAMEERLGSWRLWQLLNVHHVLSDRDLEGPGLERVYEEGEVKVYRVGDPLPRAWVVHQAIAATDEEALGILDGPGFDPRQSAVLPPQQGDVVLPGGIAGSAARVVETQPGHLVVEVAPAGDGLLIVSQLFYPGWQARVDGQKVPILRADYALQAVAVKDTSRRVELDYLQPAWPGAVSLVALLMCVAGVVVGPRGTDKG